MLFVLSLSFLIILFGSSFCLASFFYCHFWFSNFLVWLFFLLFCIFSLSSEKRAACGEIDDEDKETIGDGQPCPRCGTSVAWHAFSFCAACGFQLTSCSGAIFQKGEIFLQCMGYAEDCSYGILWPSHYIMAGRPISCKSTAPKPETSSNKFRKHPKMSRSIRKVKIIPKRLKTAETPKTRNFF